MAYNSIIETLQKEQEKANQANLTRYQDILKLSDQIAGIYAPGGAFGKGFEAQLDRSKKQTVAGGMQQLVSSGLSNTTNAAGLGQQFEENVGANARLKLEDLRMDRYSSALGAKQGFMERREDAGPDYGAVAQYANQYGQGMPGKQYPWQSTGQKRIGGNYTMPSTIGGVSRTMTLSGLTKGPSSSGLVGLSGGGGTRSRYNTVKWA